MNCHFCGQSAKARPYTGLSRRSLFGRTAAAMGAATLARSAFAAAPKTPPKPQNELTPEAALNEIMQGNHRYVQGITKRHDFSADRAALTAGQNPYVGILSCADSRVSPEFAFDTSRGDLFVARVAGNFVNDDILASFEYGVAVLHTPLLMVLGHSACGAVSSTIQSIDSGTALPGHLPSLVAHIAPSVTSSKEEAGDRLANAIRANVRHNVELLKTATPILSQAVDAKKLMVVGGYYNLATGHVDMVA